MCINTQKPKALLVTGKRLRRRVDQDTGMLEVVTDTAKIEQVASHKILGSIIDEDLTYEVHVDELCMQQHFRATSDERFPCGSFFLRISDFLCFEGTNFSIRTDCFFLAGN